MKVLILVLLLLFTMNSFNVFAADSSVGSGKFDFRTKATNKQNSRWTLEEWLNQKERNHMMDLWLAMYSPSPYEFYAGGAYLDTLATINNVEAADRRQYSRAEAGAYATVVGLSGEYINNTGEKISDTNGALNLRIAGNAVQGTHLAVFYGNRNRSMDRNGNTYYLRNQFYGGDLNLYLNHYVGVLGKFTQYIANTEGDLGEVSGSQSEYGLFVDFGAMRVSGSYYSDLQKEVLNGAETKVERAGTSIGLRFFF